jgi:hypothetical protein
MEKEQELEILAARATNFHELKEDRNEEIERLRQELRQLRSSTAHTHEEQQEALVQLKKQNRSQETALGHVQQQLDYKKE